MEIVEAEVRAALDRYLASELALDAFQEWFLSATWEDVESELVKEISHLLVEFSNEDLSEAEVRALLARLSTVVSADAGALVLGLGTGSGANTFGISGATRVIASPHGALTESSDSEAATGTLAPA